MKENFEDQVFKVSCLRMFVQSGFESQGSLETLQMSPRERTYMLRLPSNGSPLAASMERFILCAL